MKNEISKCGLEKKGCCGMKRKQMSKKLVYACNKMT